MERHDLGLQLLEVFDRIYVINLRARMDRLDEIEAQLSRVGLLLDHQNVRRFDAVRPGNQGHWPSVGARGCFMSHLGILREAVTDRLESIAILEDDLDWSQAFLTSPQGALDIFRDDNWRFLHGGIEAGAGPISAGVLDSDQDVRLTHFIAIRGDAIRRAVNYLEQMSTRPRGSPKGGPMHVDGAYTWFRRENPDIPAVICSPALGYQRPSATDIAERHWFDKVPVLRRLAPHARKLKSVFS